MGGNAPTCSFRQTLGPRYSGLEDEEVSWLCELRLVSRTKMWSPRLLSGVCWLFCKLPCRSCPTLRLWLVWAVDVADWFSWARGVVQFSCIDRRVHGGVELLRRAADMLGRLGLATGGWPLGCVRVWQSPSLLNWTATAVRCVSHLNPGSVCNVVWSRSPSRELVEW